MELTADILKWFLFSILGFVGWSVFIAFIVLPVLHRDLNINVIQVQRGVVDLDGEDQGE